MGCKYMKGIYQYRDLEILKHKFLYDEIPKFNYTIGGDGVSEIFN